MAEEYLSNHDDHSTRAKATAYPHNSNHNTGTFDASELQAKPFAQYLPASALHDGAMIGRGRGTVRASALTAMQRTHGNRAVQRALNTSGFARRVAVQRDWYDDQQADEEAMMSEQLALTGDEPDTLPNDAFSSDEPFGPVPASMEGPMHGPAPASMQDSTHGRAPVPIDGPMNAVSEQALEQIFGTTSAPMQNPTPAPASTPAPQELPMYGPALPPAPVPAPQELPDIFKQGGFVPGGVMQPEDPWLPPAAPEQVPPDVEMPERFWDPTAYPGDALNAVDASLTITEMMGVASKPLSTIGKGVDALGVVKSIYDFGTAKDNYERVQAVADGGASAIGLLGGPLGGAFSGGYSVGQLANKFSDGIGDLITGNEEGDHSLSGLLSDELLTESYIGGIHRKQQDKIDASHYWQKLEKSGQTTKSRAENANLEKKHEHETETLMGDIREKSKKSYEVIGNTGMIDPVARPGQAQGIDEDGDQLSTVSMSLAPRRR